MADFDEMVLVGRVARPHGLRGQVVIDPATDFAEERFAAGNTVWTRSPRGDELLTIAAVRFQGARPVVGFAGFERIEDAERLAGLELRVPAATLQPLADGTYYEHQLEGCIVELMSGERVGTVRRVEGGAGASRLIVDGARGDIEIPLAVDICREIDVDARRIRIEPPQGLLELNDVGSGQPAAGRRKARHGR
jgi:16S rRNA processing protein RimM